MTENEIATNRALSDEPPTWATKWQVPAVPVIIGMLILTLAVAFAFLQQKWDREATASAIVDAACETQREFRMFFTGYLESQIGTPVTEIPGFDELSPEAREFAIQLAPIVEADRADDTEALAEYIATFPIPRCS